MTNVKIMYGEKARQATLTLADGTQYTKWYCDKCSRIAHDQHMASWCCCTHKICDCGKEHKKHWTMCDDCREKQESKRWCAKPEVEWDGEFPIFDHSSSEYFFTDSDLMDHIHDMVEEEKRADEDILIEDVASWLRLSSCHPNRPRTFEVNEWCQDDMSEDGEIADADSIDDRINAILSELKIVSYSANSDRLNVMQVLKAIGFEVEQ